MLSPQIYRHNFDKTLYFNALGYPFHRMSSRFTIGGKTKGKKRKNQGKSVGNIQSPIKQKRKKEHTGGKLQHTEKAEAVEKPETKGKR